MIKGFLGPSGDFGAKRGLGTVRFHGCPGTPGPRKKKSSRKRRGVPTNNFLGDNGKLGSPQKRGAFNGGGSPPSSRRGGVGPPRLVEGGL